jgi:hypothetical protein
MMNMIIASRDDLDEDESSVDDKAGFMNKTHSNCRQDLKFCKPKDLSSDLTFISHTIRPLRASL